MKSTIRKASTEDIDAILALNKALFDFEDQFGHEYNLDWTYGEAGQKYFKKRFGSKNAIIFVAEDDKKVVGYIVAFIDNHAYRRKNPVCELENMYVDEGHRNQGIGSRLVEAVKKVARERKVPRMWVGAIVQNELAVQFYKKHGFEDVVRCHYLLVFRE